MQQFANRMRSVIQSFQVTAIAAFALIGSSIPAIASPTEEFAEAVRLASEIHLLCGGAECPKGISMLGMVDGNSFGGVCTGFLVAPDLIATNSHCISEDIRESGSSCKGRIWAHFHEPSEPRATLTVGCEQVVSAAGVVTSGDDIAFIRLSQKVDRPAFEMSRDGFSKDQVYPLVKVDPMPTSIAGIKVMYGLITRENCVAIDDTYFLAKTRLPYYPSVMMADCTSQPGNSGSPLLDSSGRVHGILQGIRTPNDPGLFRDAFRRKRLTPASDDSFVFKVTNAVNLSCLPTPLDEEGRRFPIECYTDPAEYESKGRLEVKFNHPKLAAPFVAWQAQQLEQWLRARPSAGIMKWETSTFMGKEVDEELSFIRRFLPAAITNDQLTRLSFTLPVPTCLERPQEWIRSHRRTSWFQRLRGEYPERAQVELDSEAWASELQMTQYLQFKFKDPRLTAALPTRLVFNPRQIAAKGTSTAKLYVVMKEERQKILVWEGELKACDTPRTDSN